ACLDIVVGVLVKAALTRGGFDKDNLRQCFVGIAGPTTATACKQARQIIKVVGFALYGWIVPVLVIRQKHAVLVVVTPAHISFIHRAKNGRCAVLWMARVRIPIFVAE